MQNVAFLLAFSLFIYKKHNCKTKALSLFIMFSQFCITYYSQKYLKTKNPFKMNFKTALMYAGVIVVAILVAELVKPSVNKMLGR